MKRTRWADATPLAGVVFWRAEGVSSPSVFDDRLTDANIVSESRYELQSAGPYLPEWTFGEAEPAIPGLLLLSGSTVNAEFECGRLPLGALIAEGCEPATAATAASSEKNAAQHWPLGQRENCNQELTTTWRCRLNS